jgi:hypothetical protein
VHFDTILFKILEACEMSDIRSEPVKEITTENVMMRRLCFVAVCGLLSSIATVPARADVLAGPVLNQSVGGYAASGIEFTALNSALLTGFVFQNQGAADTIELVASDGTTVLHSLNTPAGNTSLTVSGLSWALTAGSDYFLINVSSPSNGRFGASTFPVSDADIRVNAGVFQLGGGTLGNSTRTDFWSDFNNITTTTAAVPEPSPLVLLGLSSLLASAGSFWRRRRLAS